MIRFYNNYDEKTHVLDAAVFIISNNLARAFRASREAVFLRAFNFAFVAAGRGPDVTLEEPQSSAGRRERLRWAASGPRAGVRTALDWTQIHMNQSPNNLLEMSIQSFSIQS